MPKNKKNCICKNLTDSKTTILIFEKEKQTSTRLIQSLKNFGLDSSVKLHSSPGMKQVKSHDIYIIEHEEVLLEDKVRLIKKIYKANPKACVFLLGETEETKEIISKQVRPYIDAIKLGVVFESNNSKNDEELDSVIEYISSVENTKKKLTCLWQKLETA